MSSLARPACCQTLQMKRVMCKCPASALWTTSCCPSLLMAFASSRCDSLHLQCQASLGPP